MKNLGAAGHTLTVLSRHAGTNVPPGVAVVAWDPMKGPPPEDGVRNAGAVIHLAGEPVAQRWNADVKRRIRESRVAGHAQPGAGAVEAAQHAADAGLRLGGGLLRLARR